MTQRLKSLFTLLAIPLLCATLSASVAFAIDPSPPGPQPAPQPGDQFTVGELDYRVNDGGITVTLVGGNPPARFDVPDKVTYKAKEYNITAIGEDAFSGKAVTSIYISSRSKLEKIGAGAFAGCTMTRLDIYAPDLTDVGKDAFSGVNAYTDIYLDAATLKNNPFADRDEFPTSIAEVRLIFVDNLTEDLYVCSGELVFGDGTYVAIPGRIIRVFFEDSLPDPRTVYNFADYVFDVEKGVKSSAVPIDKCVSSDDAQNPVPIPEGVTLPPNKNLAPAPSNPQPSGSNGASSYERYGVSQKALTFEKGQDLSFDIDADFEQYIKLKYENETLVKGVDYTIEDSSIILNSSWLEKLGSGEHALYAEFASGDAELNVLVEK